jgi:hypothetical protein
MNMLCTTSDMEKWWAFDDSNLGQTDYEAVQPGPAEFCNLKNSNRFSSAEPAKLTETEPLPNLPEGINRDRPRFFLRNLNPGKPNRLNVVCPRFF